MATMLIAIIVSIPIGIFVNLLTPWFKTQASIRTVSRRNKRIMTLKKNFEELQAVRSGNMTNRFIALCTSNILLIIILSSSSVLMMVILGIEILRYRFEPPMFGLNFGKSATSIVFTSAEVLSILSLITTAALYTQTARWLVRVMFDEANDKFRQSTERDLNKLSSSLTNTTQTTDAKVAS